MEEEEDIMRDGVRTFSFHAGVIILSRNCIVNEQLKTNENFQFIRKVKDIELYVSIDVLEEYIKEGPPPPVTKFLISFYGS